MKKYIIFDLDGTLINSHNKIRELIYEYFNKKDKEKLDILRYSLDFNKVASLKDLLIQIYGKEDININIKLKELYEYLDKKNHESIFIDGTIEKIKKLKNKYKLYLSTGSSTKFANEMLEKGGIKQYFEIIQGSELIPKSEEHLDIFMKHSGDKMFFKKAISIGDSNKDEIFAKNRSIDFIKIGDKYKSIADIKNI